MARERAPCLPRTKPEQSQINARINRALLARIRGLVMAMRNDHDDGYTLEKFVEEALDWHADRVERDHRIREVIALQRLPGGCPPRTRK